MAILPTVFPEALFCWLRDNPMKSPNHLVHVHCSSCQFRASQRSPRRFDMMEDGSRLPSLTAGHTLEARSTRQLQKVSLKEEIAGFCNTCMQFTFVEAENLPCNVCKQPLLFFTAGRKQSPALKCAWGAITGSRQRCSLCNIWLEAPDLLQCGNCKQKSLHGTTHIITVQQVR